jgi:hypothetical protein
MATVNCLRGRWLLIKSMADCMFKSGVFDAMGYKISKVRCEVGCAAVCRAKNVSKYGTVITLLLVYNDII